MGDLVLMQIVVKPDDWLSLINSGLGIISSVLAILLAVKVLKGEKKDKEPVEDEKNFNFSKTLKAPTRPFEIPLIIL